VSLDLKAIIAARFDAAQAAAEQQAIPEPPPPAMRPDEAEAAVNSYLGEVERVYELAIAAREAPATVKLMNQLERLAPDEQIEHLAQLVNVPQPAPLEVEPDDFDGLAMDVPSVDSNNPLPQPGESYGYRMPDGTPINEEFVYRYLRSLGTGPWAQTAAEWRRRADSP
jgi:hypothetical protein